VVDPTFEFRLTELLSIIGLAGILTLLTQFFKPYVRDDFVPHVTALIGIVLALVTAVLLGLTTPIQLAEAVITGFLAGCSADGYYKLQAPTNILSAKKDN
jgi:hypothetical protein